MTLPTERADAVAREFENTMIALRQIPAAEFGSYDLNRIADAMNAIMRHLPVGPAIRFCACK